jgi:hypothetical protein
LEGYDTIKNSALLLIVILVIILMADKCSNRSGKEYILTTDTITKVVTNTLTVIDTTFRDSVITWHTQHPKKVKEYIYIDNKPLDIETPDSSETWTYSDKDSLLSYMIYVNGYKKPNNVWIKYDVAKLTIKDSTYVKDSTVTTVTNDITKKVRVNQFYIGGESIVYPQFRAALISADFVNKNGWMLSGGVGYGFFNNSSELVAKIGFKKVISFRKK